uniref:Uncharacterized protein n=1 Tax=Lates calcarifer TaxID=8187 RepID=A0A4W6F8U1_LATCA
PGGPCACEVPFCSAGPPTTSMDYHQIGRSISTLMSDKVKKECSLPGGRQQDLLNAINSFLDCSIVLPPSEMGGDELLRSVARFQREMLISSFNFFRRPFRAHRTPLRRADTRRAATLPKVHQRLQGRPEQSVHGAVIFIYFAALSPAITFGGLLGEKTDGLIGVSELIVSTAVQGVIFCLLGAQPLLVWFCKANDIEYLTGRVWIGFWLIIIVIVTVAFEGSFLVRFVSRFTQEIFSFLISLIFICETFIKLATAPCCDGPRRSPNTALLSLVLMAANVFSSPSTLRQFRRIIGDFGVPIAILIMVLVDYSIEDTYTQVRLKYHH